MDVVNYVTVCYILDIEVKEGYTGHGIGSALMEKVMEFCHNRNIDRIGLSVDLKNRNASNGT